MNSDTSVSSVDNKFHKKGRNRQSFWKRPVFLSQRANITSMPSKSECKHLKVIGLGESNRFITLNRRWNISRARQYLCRMYPIVPLPRIGFDIAKCDKRRILTVVNVDSVIELEREIRRGILILIPHRDIALPLPQVIEKILIKTEVEEPVDTELVSTALQLPQPDLRISNIISLKSEETTEYEYGFSDSDENGELIGTNNSINFEIDRNNILHSMLTVYESYMPDFITEEMYTLFWKAAERKYFRGEGVIVPFVPVHRIRKDRAIFKTLGKILGHMWMTMGTIPLNIARTIYLQIGNPFYDISDTMLLEDMLLLVTLEERILIEKALKDFARVSREELCLMESFFVSHGFYDSLTKNEFREQLLSLASDLIIHKPKELVIQMRKGFPGDSLRSFLNLVEKDQISHLLTKQRPTVQKVLNILSHGTANLPSEQLKILYYLQVYIKSLGNDSEQLLKFIFFVSGSVQMPNHITVIFNDSREIQRQIVVNKCNCTLELSFAYNSYQEFKRELNSYLSSCFF